MGDSNFLGWVVLKSDESMTNELNEQLVKLCDIKDKKYQERLVNTDIESSIFFSSTFNGNRFKKNNEIHFHILEKKYKYDFSVVMNYLNVNYRISLLDFTIYRPNMIRNDGVINHCQKVHRDYEVVFPKIIIKMKKKMKNKK